MLSPCNYGQWAGLTQPSIDPAALWYWYPQVCINLQLIQEVCVDIDIIQVTAQLRSGQWFLVVGMEARQSHRPVKGSSQAVTIVPVTVT